MIGSIKLLSCRQNDQACALKTVAREVEVNVASFSAFSGSISPSFDFSALRTSHRVTAAWNERLDGLRR